MKPIIFSTPMVKAILDGRKTQTRRVFKDKGIDEYVLSELVKNGCSDDVVRSISPYKPGDILWVRETWKCISEYEHDLRCGIRYKADYINEINWLNLSDNERYYKIVNRMNEWRPSIFMPREAARIFLEVKSVRIERVRDISDEDLTAEGMEPEAFTIIDTSINRYNRNSYRDLWDALNAKRGYGWGANPWVWVYGFERAGT